MDFRDSPEEAEFRARIRTWLVEQGDGIKRSHSDDGYWTALEMRMTDARERTRTDLVIEKIEYDVGLTPDDFSRRVLERGARLRAEGASASAQSATARPRRSSKSDVGSARLAIALAEAGR